MEFGSDFHQIDYPRGESFKRFFSKANFYTSGRQAIMALATARNWHRLWIPSYFCEETLGCLRRAGIELAVYDCLPTRYPAEVIRSLSASSNEGILVVNYWGIYSCQSFETAAEIVEDHTHSLLSGWSKNSTADWCIASLRKTIPIPDGGILWSPAGHELPPVPPITRETISTINVRYEAMKVKTSYLNGVSIDKEHFLQLFHETEDKFDTLPLSSISEISRKFLSDFDLAKWEILKKRNHSILKKSVDMPDVVTVLEPEDLSDTPFSFCLYFKSSTDRDKVRKFLIDHSVYPAILWKINSDTDPGAKDMGDRILSIHCDGRYSEGDIVRLSQILSDALKSVCK